MPLIAKAQPMNTKAPITPPRATCKKSVRSAPWFATFTFLDVSSAMSSTQMQGLVESVAKLWRRAIGRPV
jgi:hypothetical protein